MGKHTKSLALILILSFSFAAAATNTGAVWLLIAPGARAEAMGEAQVAITDDAYASYYNPAGLAFMKSNQVGAMYAKWLPSLVSDMYYTFLSGGYHVPNVGTFGGHAIYLNLGQQVRTDEYGNQLGTFFSYMTAISGSYATKINEKSAIGVNLKFVYQMLSPVGAGNEQSGGNSFHFGFDLGYQRKDLFNGLLDFGAALSNVGPKISFVDVAQADPQPTNIKVGINLKPIQSEHNSLSWVLDLNKTLAGSHPAMDVNDNYLIEKGSPLKVTTGEEAYTDGWFKGIFTSFTDDWQYTGDVDANGDGIIGGYNKDGEEVGWYDSEGNRIVANRIDNGLATWRNATTLEEVDGPGEYNALSEFTGWGSFAENADNFTDPDPEVGSQDSASFANELNEIIINTGMEYVYNNMFALRAGFIYDRDGDIMSPTFGFGFIYRGLGFDFAYTGGKEGHPLSNTMRYSLRYEF